MINRHNYEEYFLLYLDNELEPAKRAAVEIFMQQNPDLAAEMEMLVQAVLPNETVQFEKKECLLNPAEGINLSNYEEFFLLSVDKELSEKESDDVEMFVLKHPELQQQYVLLQKTKLDAEEVRFEDKSKLYKQEVKERAILLSPWFRISVAAAIVGFLVITGIFNNKQEQNTLPVVSATRLEKIKPIPVKPERRITAPVRSQSLALAPDSDNKEGKANSRVFKKVRDVDSRKYVARNLDKNKTTPTIVTDSKRMDQEENVPIQSSQVAEPMVANTSGNKNNLQVVGELPKNTTSETYSSDLSPSLVKHVVYREIDSQDDDEDKSYYIGSAEINKNKLKGLFKKAAGFFGKKNNSNDGERSLKIAGFEIKSN